MWRAALGRGQQHAPRAWTRFSRCQYQCLYSFPLLRGTSVPTHSCIPAMQVVVFLLQHGPAGSLGLILNRPTSLKMGRGRGGLPMSLDVSLLT